MEIKPAVIGWLGLAGTIFAGLLGLAGVWKKSKTQIQVADIDDRREFTQQLRDELKECRAAVKRLELHEKQYIHFFSMMEAELRVMSAAIQAILTEVDLTLEAAAKATLDRVYASVGKLQSILGNQAELLNAEAARADHEDDDER